MAPALYRADDPAFARLDARDPGYRYDLDRDIRWDLLDAPGTLAPSGVLRALGVDVDGIRAAGAWDLFEWIYGLQICHQFVELEREVLVWLKGNDGLVPTRSLEWLRDEEIKHIHTFNRFRQHLLKARPEHGERAKALLHEVQPPASLAATDGEDPATLHFVKWLAILVFEEYTVWFYDALLAAEAAGEAVQPTWLDVHRRHAQEEVCHVATDAQYVRALELSPERRHAASQRSVAWMMSRYTQTFRAPVRVLLALRPDLAGKVSEGRPPAGFMDALFGARAFAETRACAPYLEQLAAKRRA